MVILRPSNESHKYSYARFIHVSGGLALQNKGETKYPYFLAVNCEYLRLNSSFQINCAPEVYRTKISRSLVLNCNMDLICISTGVFFIFYFIKLTYTNYTVDVNNFCKLFQDVSLFLIESNFSSHVDQFLRALSLTNECC